jgi:predicted adenine nucleotide alpha hydrolase (AANH) superfamily ATPase
MKILLHTCCGNCAAFPFRALRDEGHHLAGFWFNPNIHPHEEHDLRRGSLMMLADRWRIDISFHGRYEPARFFSMSGETAKAGTERPERCRSCYRLRLEQTAMEAKKQDFNAFTTTLLISPYQDFGEIAGIGGVLAERYNVEFYLRDFRPYFRQSMEIAKGLGLYRQKYCGCIYSMEERRKKLNPKSRILNTNKI